MKFVLILVTFGVSLVLLPDVFGQEPDFMNILKELVSEEQFQTVQNVYSVLPNEIREKVAKDLLNNPGQLGKDLLNMVGPQVSNLVNNFGAQGQSQNQNQERKVKGQSQGQSGFDMGDLGNLMGKMITSNPKLAINLMLSGLMQGANSADGDAKVKGQSQGDFSFESISTLLLQQYGSGSLDSMIAVATSVFAGQTQEENLGDKRKRSDEVTVEVELNYLHKPIAESGGFGELLKLKELSRMWGDLMDSWLGQSANRVIPRLLKVQSLPEGVRLIERESGLRLDKLIKQFQNPQTRHTFAAFLLRPIVQFFKGLNLNVPENLEVFMKSADDILKNRFGLDVKMQEFIDPIAAHVRKTFKISKESLLELSAEDIELIVKDILNNEFLEPLTSAYDAFDKVKIKENAKCAKFIFCQLNRNFRRENFIRRHVIKAFSTILAFQASKALKKDDSFYLLLDSIRSGADGYDCTYRESNFCLDLMHATSHNEL